MASGEMKPTIGGMDLALHARIHAAVNVGVPREQILSHEGLTPESWERADARWQLALADSAEGDAQLLQEWDAAVASAAGQFTRRVHPIEDEIEAWIDFVRHCQQSDDFFSALQAAGLGIGDWLQLQARWNARVGSDAELCQRMTERLSGPAVPPPKLSFDPVELPQPLGSLSSANALASVNAAGKGTGDERAGDEEEDESPEDEHEDHEHEDHEHEDDNHGTGAHEPALAAAELPAFEVPATASLDRGDSESSPSQAHNPADIPEFLRRSAVDVPAPPPYVQGFVAPRQAPPVPPILPEPARVSVPPLVSEFISASGGSPPIAQPPRAPRAPTTQPMAVVLPPSSSLGDPVMAAAPPASSSAPDQTSSSPPVACEMRSIAPTDIPLASQPPPRVSPPILGSMSPVPPPVVSPPRVGENALAPPPVTSPPIAPPPVFGAMSPMPPSVVSPPMVPLSARPIDPQPVQVFSAVAPVVAQPVSPSFERVPIAPHVPITPHPGVLGDPGGSAGSALDLMPAMPPLQPMAIMPPPVVPLGAMAVAPQVLGPSQDPMPPPHLSASEAAVNASPSVGLVMPPTVIPDGFAPMPALPFEIPATADEKQQPTSSALQPQFGPPPSERFMSGASASGGSVASSLAPPRHGAREVQSAIRGSEQYQRALQSSDALSAAPAGAGGTRAVDLPLEFRAMLRGEPSSASETPAARNSQVPTGVRSSQAPAAEPPRVNAPVRFASQSPAAQVDSPPAQAWRSVPPTESVGHWSPSPMVAPPPGAAPPPVGPSVPGLAPPPAVAPLPGIAPPPAVAPPPGIAPPPAVVLPTAPSSPLPATELKPLKKLPWEK